MKNILFFLESGLGVAKLMVEQYEAIKAQNGHICCVVSTGEQEPGLIEKMKGSDPSGTLQLEGLEHHKNFSRHIKQLRRFVVGTDIRIVHVQTNWELVLAYVVKLSLLFTRSLKIVYTVHAFNHNFKYRKYITLCIINILLLLMADMVICTCLYTYRRFRLVGYKTKIIPLGISNMFFEKEWNFVPDAGVSMVFPAQFRTGKQQELIIKGFADYVRKTNDRTSRVILPGDGPLRESMLSLAKEEGVEKQVLIPGRVSKAQVKEYFDKVNIAVITSNSETFGQCVAEPFVMGKAILTTPVGVAQELIRNKENGFIIHDDREITGALLYLASHPAKIKEMAYANYQNRNQFSWESITKEYLAEMAKL